MVEPGFYAQFRRVPQIEIVFVFLGEETLGQEEIAIPSGRTSYPLTQQSATYEAVPIIAPANLYIYSPWQIRRSSSTIQA